LMVVVIELTGPSGPYSSSHQPINAPRRERVDEARVPRVRGHQGRRADRADPALPTHRECRGCAESCWRRTALRSSDTWCSRWPWAPEVPCSRAGRTDRVGWCYRSSTFAGDANVSAIERERERERERDEARSRLVHGREERRNVRAPIATGRVQREGLVGADRTPGAERSRGTQRTRNSKRPRLPQELHTSNNIHRATRTTCVSHDPPQDGTRPLPRGGQ